MHAGRRERRREVDAADPGVRVGRAQHSGVQHPRQLQIGRVDGLAARALEAVDARRRAGRRSRAVRRATARARPPRRRARPPRTGLRPPSRCGSVLPRANRLLDLRIRAAAAEVAGHARAGSPPWSVSVSRSTSATALTICPGVQKPHCSASSRTNACTIGWSRRPSIVVTFAASTLCTSVMHDSVGTPSTSTVQAPQCPSAQATFVPVSDSSSRSASASVVPTSECTS